MDKYKSTEKLLGAATLSEPLTGIADDDGGAGSGGVDNMNFAASAAAAGGSQAGSEVLYATVGGEAPNFTFGAYVPRGRNGRPVSMYEPWYDNDDVDDDGELLPQGYTSLPPDLINQTSGVKCFDTGRSCWEAEDTDEFISTLDESTILDIESFENVNEACKSQSGGGGGDGIDYWACSASNLQASKEMIVAADVHSNDDVNIYATIRKQSQTRRQQQHHQQQLQLSMISSGGPIEKIPKIMTASCYGELQLQDSTEYAIVPDTGIVSITNSIMDERSSLNSSMFEPTSLVSSIDGGAARTNGGGGGGQDELYRPSEKSRVKWWDESDAIDPTDFQQIVKQGRLEHCTSLSFA